MNFFSKFKPVETFQINTHDCNIVFIDPLFLYIVFLMLCLLFYMICY